MKIVVMDQLDLADQHVSRIHQLGEATVYDDFSTSEETEIHKIDTAEIIIASYFGISKKVIQSDPHLKYIVVPGVGYDFVDIEAATAAGITVVNCPTHNILAVAEYTIGLVFAVTRKIVTSHCAIKNNHWTPLDYKGIELRGKKLGLIGYGNIGRTVGQLAEALGMKISTVGSKSSPSQIDDLIASCDILSLHLPATPQSRHLLDERRLRLMKSSAYLINTARGSIIDQMALAKVLSEGKIAGAALDVFEREPLEGEPTEAIRSLAMLDNVVATPHIAHNTEEAIFRLGEELIANIQACIEGNPINVVI